MSKLIEVRIKQLYRTKPSEDEGKRARRIHGEQSLIRAHKKYTKLAALADPEKVSGLADEIGRLNPNNLYYEEIKILAGRLERECDKMLAIEKANEVAREMIRVGLATDLSKPKTPSSRGRRRAA